MSSSLFIKFNNAFVTPEPELQSINVWYGWSEISGHFKLCYSASFVIQSKSIIFYADLLYISLYLTLNISNFFHPSNGTMMDVDYYSWFTGHLDHFTFFGTIFHGIRRKIKKSETKQISNTGTFFCPSACLNSSISLLHTHYTWKLALKQQLVYK